MPGHWEGDLLIGKQARSAIGVLVERSSLYVMLLHLPNGRSAEDVRLALTRQVSKLLCRFDQALECRMTTAAMPATTRKPQEVQKEDAMWLQKDMIAKNYHQLAAAHEEGKKISATFVPGNLNELLMCFDFVRRLPETDALQNGMRKKSAKMIMEAERDGHSEDVCTYVKSDLGMMLQGEFGPTGEPMPHPDVLLLSYTGCFTFMKWFELVRQKYDCETLMLHVPYQGASVAASSAYHRFVMSTRK